MKKIVEGNKLQILRREPKNEKIQTNGQATKSARGMPWHQEPTKDAAICEKPRGVESRHRSVGIRMGKPGRAILCQHMVNQIVICGEPPELKHLSRARKRNQPRFCQQWRANAKEAKPRVEIFAGLGQQYGTMELSRRTWDGPPKRVIVSQAKREVAELYPEYRRTRETRWEYGGTILQA